MPVQLQPISLSSKKSKETLVPIIENKLFWICDSQPPKNCKDSIYFCVDEELIYEPLNNDFGPFCIENTLNFIQNVERLLSSPEYANIKIYHYTSSEDAEMKVNSAFLIGAFQILCLGRTAEEVYQKFRNIEFITFRDSSDIKNDYKCTLLDCLRGVEYGNKLNWFSQKNFDLQTYQTLKKLDITIIVPNKLIAFQNPELFSNSENICDLTVDQSINIFKQLGVKLVIRLNKSQYSPQLYERNGIKHLDLIFPDGSSPSEDIVQRFLQEVESVDGMVAVHCKAGRGRTGTLIGCYAMKHYRFPAKDFIGYIRVMRPGSIHGPQQPFLNHVQKKLIEQGSDSEIWSQVKHLVELESEKKIQSSNTLVTEEKSQLGQGRPRSRVKSLMISKQQSSNSNQSDDQTPMKNSYSLSKGSAINENSTASSASSNVTGVTAFEDSEQQIRDFTQITEKYMVTPPVQTPIRKPSINFRHIRNISAFYSKNDSNSYLNSSFNQNDLSYINSLQNTRTAQQSVENGRDNRRLGQPSTSKNGKRVVGRKQFVEDKTESLHSFYGLDNDGSSSTLNEKRSRPLQPLNKPALNPNDAIFNNLCNLHNKYQTKAQEKLNKTCNGNILNKPAINRKSYIIKQYSRPLAQIN